MKDIYFEVKGEALLEKIGISKAEFARRMGIQRQNVKALFRSKDLRVIHRAAEVLEVPWEMLVGFVDEPDSFDSFEELDPVASADSFEILPEDIPTGNSVEDRRTRQKLIQAFYAHWKELNPELRVFNDSLQDYIYVKYISIQETAGHAALTYHSTLAVLQLNAILRESVLEKELNPKQGTANQMQFQKMLQMRHVLPGIGRVKLMVGVKRSDKMKVQYCITAIEPVIKAKQPQ